MSTQAALNPEVAELLPAFVDRFQGQTISVNQGRGGLPKLKDGARWRWRVDAEVAEVFEAVAAAGLGRIAGDKLEVFGDDVPTSIDEPTCLSAPQESPEAAPDGDDATSLSSLPAETDQSPQEPKAMLTIAAPILTNQRQELHRLQQRARELGAQLGELESALANLKVEPSPYVVPVGNLAQELLAEIKRAKAEAANQAEAEELERSIRTETQRKHDAVKAELEATQEAIVRAEKAIAADAAELAARVDEFEALTQQLRTCYQALTDLKDRGNLAAEALVFWTESRSWPKVNRDKHLNGWPSTPRTDGIVYVQDADGWYEKR